MQPESGRKLRVGILFGGKSAEHEVSIQSARNVLQALDQDRFEPVLIGIDKDGHWHLSDAAALLASSSDVGQATFTIAGDDLAMVPGAAEQTLVAAKSRESIGALDVIFPILHGPMGEDGTVQGLLELANVPYVGPGVLGSAIGMDKDVMKRLLRDAGIAITDFVVLHRAERATFDSDATIKRLGLPLFVKPANMGSSVGVSKVTTADELRGAVDASFEFDRKILIERAVVGDEVECAILGNDQPRASLPGRIMPQADFYSYTAKYLDEKGATLEIPATLPTEIIATVQDVATRTFQTLECEGMARVDMFVTADGQVIVNEINTIPGFTKISMYPKLWEVSGLGYTDLISQLIDLAIERFEQRQKLHSSAFD